MDAPLSSRQSPSRRLTFNTQFTGAFYKGTSSRWYAISFGTDSTLLVTNGWDNVTGVGTPNGAAFVNGVVNQVH